MGALIKKASCYSGRIFKFRLFILFIFKFDYLFFVFFLSLFSVIYLVGFVELSTYNIFSVIYCLLVLFLIKKIPLLQIILCFCFLFPFYSLPYSLGGVPISDYYYYQKDLLFFDFLLINNIFFLGVYIGLKMSSYSPYDNSRVVSSVPVFKNDVLVMFVSICIIFGCLMFKGENIFSASNSYLAYVNNLKVEGGLPEYLLVIIFIGFLFKVKRKFVSIFFVLALFFYFYNLFVMGYRVQALMFILLLFVFFFESRIKSSFILPGFLVGFISFSLLGFLKDGGLNDFDFSRVFFDTSNGFVLSHHTAVIYSSMAVIANIDNGNITSLDRVMNFFGLFANSIIPSGVVSEQIEQANLGAFVRKYATTSGGFYFPVAFYSFLGLLGPLIAGFIVSVCFSFSSNKAILNRLPILSYVLPSFSVFIFITFPRWISYDIGNFFLRLPLYCLLLICVLRVLVVLTKGKTNAA